MKKLKVTILLEDDKKGTEIAVTTSQILTDKSKFSFTDYADSVGEPVAEALENFTNEINEYLQNPKEYNQTIKSAYPPDETVEIHNMENKLNKLLTTKSKYDPIRLDVLTDYTQWFSENKLKICKILEGYAQNTSDAHRSLRASDCTVLVY